MGTSYSVRVVPAPSASNAALLKERIEQSLERVNRQMSTYRADSDLMRFNRSRSLDWQPVPAELAHLVARAAAISRASDGLYDITAGPLVNLWGFGNSGRRQAPPDADQIDALLPHIGHDKLQSRASPAALRKLDARIEIDLSSIAKGWAVDQLAALLDDAGVDNYLVEIGGELRGRGRKPDGSAWHVAIERPADGVRQIHSGVALVDAALATSGDYRNYFEADGMRFAHTIDPRSGRPVHHRLASVSVIADNCADADAWATALLALGQQRGPEVAEIQGLQALFLVRDGQGFVAHASSAWQAAGASEGRQPQ